MCVCVCYTDGSCLSYHLSPGRRAPGYGAAQRRREMCECARAVVTDIRPMFNCQLTLNCTTDDACPFFFFFFPVLFFSTITARPRTNHWIHLVPPPYRRAQTRARAHGHSSTCQTSSSDHLHTILSTDFLTFFLS